jgi:hypothetical protein
MSRQLSYHERLVLGEFFQDAYLVAGEVESVVHWRVRANELSANRRRLAKLVRALEQRGVWLEAQQRAEFNRGQRVAERVNKRLLREFGRAQR